MSPPPPPNSDPTARTEATFNSALELPPSEREAFLTKVCGDDRGLVADVRAMLAAEVARLKPEGAGEHIGPYKLLQQIGQGGFGVVWMAEQEKPVRRRVALKIIKLGMDTKEVIVRFEQERQALAMMDHPNIARVFDAGATQFGRPFFVMELVRGVRITEYCDGQSLSTAERIGLFIHVCQAVQHAHQKGIIHRDLKPSNILVTINDGEAVPKVIDFGVAKATQGRLTDGTLFTQFDQMIGTPLYMSPEQAEMTSLDIDTRSDIYSLGVLLYELLTGRTPIDSATMARAGMDEIRRIIREVDPPRPSARMKTLGGGELTTAAKRRHTEAAKLPGALRGDLDWIVMKCLEKDRNRRYDTANGLALDLQRHLANEVVIARPPTAGYLLSKLIRRNKAAFAAGAAIVAALVIGIAASVWQAVRATRAEKSAVAAFDELRATAPAFAEQARALAAKEQFDEAITKLDYAVKLRPDAPEYLVAKGDLLQCQLKIADAAAIYREALRVKPGLARAEASAKLCDELLASPTTEHGKLTRESLAKLHLAMQKQQRPAAELMPVARLLGEEKKLIVEYWLARLKDLPVSAEKPLDKRLEVGDDGLLKLDLSDTKIADLALLTGMPLGKLDLSKCDQITDFAPLHEFRSLTDLALDHTEIRDLSPLRGLPLESLSLLETRIFDISALRGMKLKSLTLRDTRVADLSVLAKMPLTYFDATAIPATDYSPLAGAPLKSLWVQSSPLRDLSFLKDSPLKELSLGGSFAVRGYAVLAGLKSLDLLLLPSLYREIPDEELAAIAALRSHPTLKNIQADYDEHPALIRTAQPKDIFWKDWDREQTFVPALRATGNKFTLTKLPAGSYSLEIIRQPLRDLSILKGAPISKLTISSCQVVDLTPLHDLPIEYLNIGYNPFSDVSPLRGMQIKTLFLSNTKVSDLSPLTSLPLTEIYLGGCENVTDVALLAEIPTLEKVVVPVQAANIEALRKLTKLKRLAFQHTSSSPYIPITTAEEFWEQWPSMAWARALNDAGMKYTANQDAEGKWSITVIA